MKVFIMKENEHKEEPALPKQTIFSRGYGALAMVSSFPGLLLVGSTIMNHFNFAASPVVQVLGLAAAAVLSFGIGTNASRGYCVMRDYNYSEAVKQGFIKAKPS